MTDWKSVMGNYSKIVKIDEPWTILQFPNNPAYLQSAIANRWANFQ